VNDSLDDLPDNFESLMHYIEDDLACREVLSEQLSELISRFKEYRPDYVFTYPLPLFSEVPNSAKDLDMESFRRRNSFLRHAYPTTIVSVHTGLGTLDCAQDMIKYLYPGMRVITASLMGSYVYPRIATNNSDIDINVFYEGIGFQHRVISIEDIPPELRQLISRRITSLEIVTIGDQNAVLEIPTDDSFTGATAHENVVGIITSGLWNRDVPIFGRDYMEIVDNKQNLLRLAYDLMKSAVRRYQNKDMIKHESEIKRLKKTIGRSLEARIYLEEAHIKLIGNHSRIFLPEEPEGGFSDDEIIYYADYVLGRDLDRYLKVRKIITGQ